jgi:PKD repeat protein
VAANPGAARQGNIDVEGRLHTINQAGGGTDPATEWSWTVSLNGHPVITSNEPSFTHRFSAAGMYTVELEAGNCFGSATATQMLEVLPPPPPEDFLVPAAAHAPGLNETVWRTDLRIFNPCLDTVDVTIEYLPEATDNSNAVIHGLEFLLEPDATQIFDDIVQQIPGIQGDDNKGSLRFTFDGGNGCTPLIVSRTYNDTPEGTFGQYVPAVPVVPLDVDRVFLTGMVDNFYYRTNVGLANFGPDNVGNIGVTVYDEFGVQLGDTITTWVPGYSTRQIVEVIEAAGILTDVNIFSVAIDTNGADLTMYASVVDNFTGDPVYVSPAGTEEVKVWIPGIAHLPGANESLWRSDITFLNETEDLISARVDYVPEVDLGYSPFMIMNIDPGNALYYVDVLGVSMLPPDTESKGYFVVTSRGDYGVPHMVARTYNLAGSGGTFGQNLKVFGDADLIHEGESGFILGVGNSPSPDTGFRTNVGVLNTDTDTGATISVTLYDTEGDIVASLSDYWIPPAKFVQYNIFQALGIDEEMHASIEVHVVSGGPVAVYASEIDNRTQDPILVPAVVAASPGQ